MLEIIKLPLLLFICINLLLVNVANAGDDFPGRKKYRSVPYITLEDLYKKKDEVVIVDTRSNYEYSILHIKNALNIPISNFDFSDKVSALYNSKRKTIVFYCNGHTCSKSYDAVQKAKRLAKIKDTLAFDGGIFDWVQRYPKHSVLLNTTITDVSSLISKDEFKKHLLKPKAFLDKSNSDCLVLDVRDSSQRADRIFAGFEKAVNLDDTSTLDNYIKEARNKNQALCIYDAVGKQVRWLQYHLKEQKVKNYYFLEGGAKSFFATPYKTLYGD